MAVEATQSGTESDRRGYYVEIFLVSFAALLLEISYTRVISFKLFYYYTYLVIGLALLGIGTGGVMVAISRRVREASTDTILLWSSLLAATSVGVGYVVVAVTSLDTFAIWDYGSRASFSNVARLVLICLMLFLSFVAVGVVVATLFSRRPDRIGRLYFADLLGAGLACALVVSLLGWIGPPATIFLAGVLLAGAGLRIAVRVRSRTMPVAVLLVALFAVAVVKPAVLPEQRLEATKLQIADTDVRYSSWSPLFRVDVVDLFGVRALFHDGLLGSEIDPYNGNVASLDRFDRDPRSFPFAALGTPPGKELIIGAAGGHEILASLRFDAKHVDAVELNPVTHDLLSNVFADYAGHIAQDPRVNYVKDEGRSYLARRDGKYNLIWYPAPDSYSASNAASAGAFVLSESYLYTAEAVKDSLEHLRQGGIVAAQFGEYDYANRPNRTTRYVSTARQALEDLGVEDPASHMIVVRTPDTLANTLSTILVKRTPFTKAEVDRVVQGVEAVPGSTLVYAPGHAGDGSAPAQLLETPGRDLDAWFDAYPYDVRPVTDDQPFFWHFTKFGEVARDFSDPISRTDREVQVGERVLILLLLIASVLAAIFLLLPFVTIRRIWSDLRRKPTAAVYFSALGLGFIFFEITLIQRLTLVLGYPTYSLTVTLGSLLVFTGVGALLSTRYEHHRRRVVAVLLGILGLLTLFYLFALPQMTDGLLGLPLAARIAFAFVAVAPLGICLGAFMPLGLGAVSGLSEHPREYVAWGWAVNGFASVIGSVLSTILAMTFGFRVVLILAFVLYLVAVAALRVLLRPAQVAVAP